MSLPVAPLPTPYSHPGRVRPLLRCAACLRVELRPPDTLQRPAAGRWPECCGRPMVPAVPAGDRAPDPDADATPWADRRGRGRRFARADARVECRAADTDVDAAIALIDVSAGGLKVAIRGLLRRGDRVRVAVGPPGGPWAYHGPAAVRWCVPGAEGTALAGLRLPRPLTAQAVGELTESTAR